MRRLTVLVVLICAAGLLAAAPAAASGPAPHGKNIVQVNCGSAGTFWVSVPKSDNNNGAGQIVGMKGHGIGVSFTFTVIDQTTGVTLFSDTSSVGKGARPPQPANDDLHVLAVPGHDSRRVLR